MREGGEARGEGGAGGNGFIVNTFTTPSPNRRVGGKYLAFAVVTVLFSTLLTTASPMWVSRKSYFNGGESLLQHCSCT